MFSIRKILYAGVFLSVMAGSARAADPLPDSLKNGEFIIGCQAWTFNHFTTFEAIEKTKASGGKVIELFPGQTLMAGSETKVGPDMSAADVQKLKDKLALEGIKVVAFGVTGVSTDENNARKLFAWAKDLDIRIIVTESTDAIDTLEKMVKEFDIKVGFHDHPRQPNNPNYKMWDPYYILSVVKDRDTRIGSCADTGHWVRSGLNPVYCLQVLKGRIVDSHLKDLHEFSAGGHDVPYGTGKSDVPAILDEFKRQGFNGPIEIEYEYKQENNLPEVTQCVSFVRNYKTK